MALMPAILLQSRFKSKIHFAWQIETYDLWPSQIVLRISEVQRKCCSNVKKCWIYTTWHGIKAFFFSLDWVWLACLRMVPIMCKIPANMRGRIHLCITPNLVSCQSRVGEKANLVSRLTENTLYRDTLREPSSIMSRWKVCSEESFIKYVRICRLYPLSAQDLWCARPGSKIWM